MKITNETITNVMRKHYNEIRTALDEAEQEYSFYKRSVKKRETYQFIAAQEMIINEICSEIGIELTDDNLELIKPNINS